MQLFRDFAKAIADDEPGCFLGTIVTIPRSDGALEVVDGQQRLATNQAGPYSEAPACSVGAAGVADLSCCHSRRDMS